MKSAEYKMLSERTMAGGFHLNTENEIHVLHCAMGVITELTELVEAFQKPSLDVVNLIEEIGDVFWYLAILERIGNFELEPDTIYLQNTGYENVRAVLMDSFVPAGNLLDRVKKKAFYNRDCSEEIIEALARHIFNSMTMLASFIGADIEYIREVNIRKLQARFPDKFTNENANVRNLNAEREILEG